MVKGVIGTWRGYLTAAREKAKKDQVRQLLGQVDRLKAERALLKNDYCALLDDHLHLKVQYENLQFERLQDWQLGRPEIAREQVLPGENPQGAGRAGKRAKPGAFR